MPDNAPGAAALGHRPSKVNETFDASQVRTLDVALRILKGAVAAKASDIHLRAGVPPMVRIEGNVCPLDHPPLPPALVESAVATFCDWAGVGNTIHKKQLEFSCDVPEVGRFRAHAYLQKGSWAIVLRHIPTPIPDLATLRLPPVIKRIATTERGLILVTGATGNGKSTTIAALLQHINTTAAKHVVTIEEPIEFMFQDGHSTFSQREVGRDVDSMHQGLLGALREDPDVLFVGEIRTHEEFEVALSAAESGHVVVSTFHSTDAMRTISRMLHFYPVDFRDAVRQRLADALAAIVAQRLIPRRGGADRVLATEVLTRSPTVQECVRDAARIKGLSAALDAATHEHGSYSLDACLMRLLRENVISVDTAKAAASNPNDLVRNLRVTR